jgi:hypothetical protein
VTVIVRPADVVVLPATSVATAVSVWLPTAVVPGTNHEIEYGDVVSVASSLVPSK